MLDNPRRLLVEGKNVLPPLFEAQLLLSPHLFEIHTRAEGFACPCNDQCTHLLVLPDTIHRIGELCEKLPAQGVSVLRMVQRDGCQSVLNLVKDLFIWQMNSILQALLISTSNIEHEIF